MGCAVQTRGFPKRRAAVRLTILLLAALHHDVRRKRDVAFVNAVLVVVAQHSGATAATAPGILQQALCGCAFAMCLACWFAAQCAHGCLHSDCPYFWTRSAADVYGHLRVPAA